MGAMSSGEEAGITGDTGMQGGSEERLDLIAKLKRKYGASIEEILEHMTKDQAELDTIVNRGELVMQLQQQDGELRREIGAMAQQISARRSEAAGELATAMEAQLNDLNMQRARFLVEIQQIPDEEGVPVSVNGEPEQYYA